MKITIDPDIKKLSIFVEGDEIPKVIGRKAKSFDEAVLIHEVRNPRLITDPAEFCRLSSPLRDAVIKTYQFDERTTEYDGVSVRWSEINYPKVWSPSIDTILFASALRKRLILTGRISQYSSLLEIGCGSGFLTKYALVKRREKTGVGFNRAHLMDINKDALRCALDTLEHVRGDTEIMYTHNQVQKQFSITDPYDLVICNPPYIPRPGAGNTNPFEGLFLYQEILRTAKTLLHKKSSLFITFSSLSEESVRPFFEKLFTLHRINSLRVPLKIPPVFSGLSKESRTWVSYLKRQGKLEVDIKEVSGHLYWERISVFECRLRNR